MQITIDRFEGDFAIIELPDKSFLNIPRKLFDGAVEGDVVDITINAAETELRRKNVKKLMDELFID